MVFASDVNGAVGIVVTVRAVFEILKLLMHPVKYPSIPGLLYKPAPAYTVDENVAEEVHVLPTAVPFTYIVITLDALRVTAT